MVRDWQEFHRCGPLDADERSHHPAQKELVRAIRTLQVITDDFDGTELKPGQGQTVRFSFEGNEYAIDLSDKNYKRFTAEIEVWASKAHTPEDTAPAAKRRTARSTRTAAKAAGPDMKAVRDWARDNGLTVSNRGRVSTEIRDAYTAAH